MRLRLAALAVACAIGLGACGGSNDEPAHVARLVVAQPVEPASLNPLYVQGAVTSVVVPLIYSYLLTDDDHDVLQPDVAAEVPTRANGGISRDGRTITYHLRRGVTWQDGAPLTAHDVAFTFGAIMNPRNNVPTRSGYEQIARVDALDDATVRVTLHRPYSPILGLFFAPNQNYPILPQHLLAKYPNLNQVEFNREPIGSGPYRVAEWVRGDHVRLVRNEHWFGGVPRIAEIDLRFVSDTNTIINQLRTGEVTAYMTADAAHLAEYSALTGERVVRAPFAGIGDLFFNMRDPDVGDVRVRRAIVEGADFPAIVRKATRGAQWMEAAPRALFGWTYDPSIGPPGPNAADAARLLDAAGWHRRADGVRAKDGRPLSLQLSFVAGRSVDAALAVQLQQQLANLGVQLALHSYASAQFNAPASSGGPIFGGKFQIAFTQVGAPADGNTDWFLSSSQFPPRGFNLSYFSDPAVDAAERAGVSTYDPAARKYAAAIVQKRVAAELPFVALWQLNAIYVVPTELRGFRPSLQTAFWNVGTWNLGAPEH